MTKLPEEMFGRNIAEDNQTVADYLDKKISAEECWKKLGGVVKPKNMSNLENTYTIHMTKEEREIIRFCLSQVFKDDLMYGQEEVKKAKETYDRLFSKES